jgi:chaperone required for assembly of F1-ATPase
VRSPFEDIFAEPPFDPTEAARLAMRPQLRRRFYERARVEEGGDGFSVVLDGRPVKTPARRSLAAPFRIVAQALADEWEAQRDVIDPATMPLTRLVNSIVDGVADAPDAIAADVEKYLASDLVYYRADAPERLAARQAAAWDPVLTWAREALGANFAVAQEMVFIRQPAAALSAAGGAIPRDPWRLGALHSVTTLTGSALLALALLHGALSVDAAWAAAHVDEDWNMELWGRDELAMQRRGLRFAEMRAAALILQAAH